jgi:arsenate reductase
MTVMIFHNPDCGTSRNALAMIEASGETPVVVRYLETGWTEDLLQSLATRIGVPLRDLIRDKGAPARELGLLEADVAEGRILAAMVAHPILVNRPIVVTPRGAALCRPSETVLALLDAPAAAFTKEDGEQVGTA